MIREQAVIHAEFPEEIPDIDAVHVAAYAPLKDGRQAELGDPERKERRAASDKGLHHRHVDLGPRIGKRLDARHDEVDVYVPVHENVPFFLHGYAPFAGAASACRCF